MVDDLSGVLPLYMKVFTDLLARSWHIFFHSGRVFDQSCTVAAKMPP